MVPDFVLRKANYLRHQISEKSLYYNNPEVKKRFSKRLYYMAGFFGLAMTVPQIIMIWSTKDATGISLATWVSYFICCNITLWYVSEHKLKPMLMIYSLWFVFYLAIIVGTVLYG